MLYEETAPKTTAAVGRRDDGRAGNRGRATRGGGGRLCVIAPPDSIKIVLSIRALISVANYNLRRPGNGRTGEDERDVTRTVRACEVRAGAGGKIRGRAEKKKDPILGSPRCAAVHHHSRAGAFAPSMNKQPVLLLFRALPFRRLVPLPRLPSFASSRLRRVPFRFPRFSVSYFLSFRTENAKTRERSRERQGKRERERGGSDFINL